MLSELFAFDSVTPSNILIINAKKSPSRKQVSLNGQFERAGGFAYNSNDRLREDQFIVWLVENDIVHLREYSFGFNIQNGFLQLRYSNSAVLHCSLFESKTCMTVLVCTTDGVSIVTFTKNTKNSFRHAVWHNKSARHEFYPIKGLNPSDIVCALSFLDENATATFFYGLKGGSILLATINTDNNDSLDVHELHQVSRYFKLWSGIVPTLSGKPISETAETPIGLELIASTCASKLLVSINRDHQLRAWDLNRKQCIIVMDLLAELQIVSKQFKSLSEASQRQLAFAPGANHRMRSFKSATPDSQNLLLIYFDLVPSGKLQVVSTTGLPLTFWIWVQLDTLKQHASVIQIEPIHLDNHHALIDFVPSVVTSIQLPNQFDENDFMVTNNITDSQKTVSTLGVWSLVDVPCHEAAGMSSQPTLQWTECGSRDTYQVNACNNTQSVLPPGYNLGDGVAAWQQALPSEIFITTAKPTSFHEEMFEDVEQEDHEEEQETFAAAIVSAFVEFIFTPGRFSKLAIYNAFKSIEQSHNLALDNFTLDQSLLTLQEEMTRMLIDTLHPKMSNLDFKTLLTTLHMSAMDYHGQFCQPLGLFGLTPTDVVVIRKTGFSIPRRLQSTEDVLWNRIAVHDGLHLEDKATSATIRSQDHILEHCRRLVKRLSHSKVWSRHERALCSNLPNFAQSDELDKLLIELEIEDSQVAADELIDFLKGTTADLDDQGTLFMGFTWVASQLQSSDEYVNLHGEDQNIDVDYENMEDETYEENIAFLGDASHIETSKCNKLRKGDLGSNISAELFRQALLQTTDSRLRFCVALHFLWRRFQREIGKINDSIEEKEPVNSRYILEDQLGQIYRSLIFIRWMVNTRTGSPADENYLSTVWMHLKLLGMHPWAMTKCSAISSTSTDLTLFEELYLTSDNLRLSQSTSQMSWQIRASRAIALLQRSFCPVLAEGEPMVGVFRHLLVGANCNEILVLCKYLAPSLFSSIDLHCFLKMIPEPENYEISGDVQSWWPGDPNLLYICATLALLWSGLTDEAVEQYIQGSIYHRKSLINLLPNGDEGAMELRGSHTTSPCWLLTQLFPGEFQLDALGILLSQPLPSTPFIADEIQVRFLIKLLPVLEKLDKSYHVIRLCEYSLSIIEQAAVTAYDKDLLNFKADPQLSSLLCGPSLLSNGVQFSQSHISKASAANNLLPVSAVCTSDLEFVAVAQHLSELEAALRTRIFKHELALGNSARAHALVLSNPDKARQRDCLHMLITTLCDKGETTSLVNFEYGSMESDLISILESRARASDMFPKLLLKQTTKANGDNSEGEEHNPFYDVLYAFHVRRGKFHSAAEICFEQAIRLAEESTYLLPTRVNQADRGLAILQRQALCLCATINALHLVSPDDQWLIKPGFAVLDDDDLDQEPEPDDNWAFDQLSCEQQGEDDFEEVEQNENEAYVRQAEGRCILKLADIQHQHLLLCARLRLAQVSWEQFRCLPPSSSITSVACLRELYVALTATGLFDEAYRVMNSFNLDPETMVSAIASRCGELAQHKLTSGTAVGFYGISVPCLPALTYASASPLGLEKSLIFQSVSVLSDYFDIRGEQMTLSVGFSPSSDLLELYWILLNLVLIHFHEASTASIPPRGRFDLSLGATRILLASQPKLLQLPGWLTQHLLPSADSPGALVPFFRLLLEFGHLQEAHRLASDLISSSLSIGSGINAVQKTKNLQQLRIDIETYGAKRIKSGTFCLPHNLLLRLLDKLKSTSKSSTIDAAMHTELQSLLKQYYTQLLAVSI